MRKASERVGPRPRQFYFLPALLLLLIPDGDQGFLLLALRGRGAGGKKRRGDEKLGEGRHEEKEVSEEVETVHNQQTRGEGKKKKRETERNNKGKRKERRRRRKEKKERAEAVASRA